MQHPIDLPQLVLSYRFGLKPRQFSIEKSDERTKINA